MASDRDKILDELTAALESWYQKETASIQKEATFMKSVIKGRSAASRAQKANAATARILVIDDITTFLAGT